MVNVFLTPDISSPPGDFSKVHISQKIVFLLWKAFFRHPEQKNRFFKENVFLTPEVCSFDPGGGAFHPPATDHHATNTQRKKRKFNVFYTKCSFDPADTQASKQTIYFSKTLLYEEENKHHS